jgi:FSR family fosmidomycin resistance protein-like MFS transporter
MIGGIIMSAILFKFCPPLAEPEKPKVEIVNGKRKSQLLTALHAAWFPLLMLYLITVIRSGFQMMTNNYLPFMLKEQGASLISTGHTLTIFLLMGGIGGLIGGFLAEKYSGRMVTLASGLLAAPLLVSAFMTHGTVSLILLGLGGFVLLSTLPVNVAMAQELVPGQTSTVSALMMGAAWGIGSLAPQAFRSMALTQGFQKTLTLAAALTILSAVCAFFLPREEYHHQPIAETGIAAAVGD